MFTNRSVRKSMPTRYFSSVVAAVLSASGSSGVLAQCLPGEDFAVISTSGDYRWWIDTDYNADVLPGDNPQWGLAGDQFLAGEPLVGVTPNGIPSQNGIDELIACRPGLPAAGQDPNLLYWYLRFADGWTVIRQWGLKGDRALVGRFVNAGSAYDDHAAVVRPNPARPGMSYFITDANNNLVYDPGTDYFWDQWPVMVTGADRIRAGDFDLPREYNSSEDVAVWRNASGIWELYAVDTVGPIGPVPRPTPLATVQFGLPGDCPVTADVNGDGFTDLLVWRPSDSRLYINLYESGAPQGGYGPNGDVDLPPINWRDAINFVCGPGCTWTEAVGLNWNKISDTDGDQIPDCRDNCPTTPNYSQADQDRDGVGDVCDTDIDGDGTPNSSDCAPTDPSRWQNRAYPDPDRDAVRNSTSLVTVDCFGSNPPTGYTLNASGLDNCPGSYNPGQCDRDSDGVGDACDTGCPSDFNGDGFVTGDDFDDYVALFVTGGPCADVNFDGFVNGDDFDLFVAAFERGC